ncbi:hypothetical protein BT69DRAFT_1349092 [Atractiella rhizophila]|nr:hypothetical protein BT69DRAFT_1349092 [Atractiella rhizophila]
MSTSEASPSARWTSYLQPIFNLSPSSIFASSTSITLSSPTPLELSGDSPHSTHSATPENEDDIAEQTLLLPSSTPRPTFSSPPTLATIEEEEEPPPSPLTSRLQRLSTPFGAHASAFEVPFQFHLPRSPESSPPPTRTPVLELPFVPLCSPTRDIEYDPTPVSSPFKASLTSTRVVDIQSTFDAMQGEGETEEGEEAEILRLLVPSINAESIRKEGNVKKSRKKLRPPPLNLGEPKAMSEEEKWRGMVQKSIEALSSSKDDLISQQRLKKYISERWSIDMHDPKMVTRFRDAIRNDMHFDLPRGYRGSVGLRSAGVEIPVTPVHSRLKSLTPDTRRAMVNQRKRYVQ